MTVPAKESLFNAPPPGSPPPTPPPTPAPPDGDWRNVVPEQYRQWQEVQTSDSPEKFFSQVENLRSLIGRSVRLPGKDASADQQRAFLDDLMQKVPGLMPTPNPDDADAYSAALRALGAPDKPDAYTVPTFEDFTVPPELAGRLQGLAHKAGLTKKQFEAFVGEVLAGEAQSRAASASAHQQAHRQLQTEWGMAAAQNYAQARVIAEKTGAPPEVLEAIDKGTLPANTVRWLHGLAVSLTGGTLEVALQQGAPSGKLTPAEAKTQLDEIYANPAHPFFDRGHPGNGAAVERVLELSRAAAGG